MRLSNEELDLLIEAVNLQVKVCRYQFVEKVEGETDKWEKLGAKLEGMKHARAMAERLRRENLFWD